MEDDHPLPSLTVLRWSLRVGGGSLDDHCQRVKLQRIFLRWRTRLHEQQQAKYVLEYSMLNTSTGGLVVRWLLEP